MDDFPSISMHIFPRNDLPSLSNGKIPSDVGQNKRRKMGKYTDVSQKFKFTINQNSNANCNQIQMKTFKLLRFNQKFFTINQIILKFFEFIQQSPNSSRFFGAECVHCTLRVTVWSVRALYAAPPHFYYLYSFLLLSIKIKNDLIDCD